MRINRLQLTARGAREISARSGNDRGRFFTPARWIAPKDLAHTLWLNDLRVVFFTMTRAPDVLLPAWALQRAAGSAIAIPDLIAIWKRSGPVAGVVLACGVDLGNEPLKGVFNRSFFDWASGAVEQ